MSAAPDHDTTSGELSLSLQLSRAGIMAVTRLQLAIQSGDRQQAMAAMDRLHMLDAEMEQLVRRLPPPAEGDPQWSTISKHVSDQKLAIAFEKLALVSAISGPDLVSPPAIPLPAQPPADWPLADIPLAMLHPAEVQPTSWQPALAGLFAVLTALLLTVALAVAVMLMTGP